MKITVQTTVNAPISKVWEYWNKPEHITGWAFASETWEAPAAENDLRVGGKFKTTMSAKDPSTSPSTSSSLSDLGVEDMSSGPNGSGQVRESFDLEGTYPALKEHELIEYNMSDGRHVKVEFEQTPDGVKVTETFDPENENSEEVQRSGWQVILNNFKKYTEANT